MNQKICIAASGPHGPTFMEWTIYFLSGQLRYWHNELGPQTLVEQPLQLGTITYRDTDVENKLQTKYLEDLANAHNHKKNTVYGKDHLKKMLDYSNANNNINGHYIWVQMFDYYSNIAKRLKLSFEESGTIENNKKIIQTMHQDFSESIDYCLEQNFKLIYIHSDPTIPLYYLNRRRPDASPNISTPSFKDPNIIITDNQLYEKEFEELFYKKHNRPTEIKDIWDKREQLALDMRPFDFTRVISRISPTFNRKREHYFINCLTFWQNFENQVVDLMNYLEIKIMPHQYEKWKPIYREWQKIQARYLDFNVRINDIMDSIINGWHYKIGHLTFSEEATIQHILIYKYGLNLKTWQLETFPINAQEIHLLLEPCTHPVELLYP